MTWRQRGSGLFAERPTPTPLRDLFARRGIDFGVTTTPSEVAQAHIASLVGREASVFVGENSVSLGVVRPSSITPDWASPDAAASFAASANLNLECATHLIWHSDLPSWVTSISSAAELRQVVETHIEEAITRYPQQRSWNVVNEAIATWNSQPGGWRDTVFYRKFGSDFPLWAFQHAADVRDSVAPGAKLGWVTNHGHDADPGEHLAGLAAVTDLLEAGAPIDYYGEQMHLQGPGDDADGDTVAERLLQYVDLGLDIKITEFDVYDNDATWPATGRRQAQADHIEGILRTIFEAIPVSLFALWSTTDAISWLDVVEYGGTRSDGLRGEFCPFDRSGWVKPEWWDMFNRVTSP